MLLGVIGSLEKADLSKILLEGSGKRIIIELFKRLVVKKIAKFLGDGFSKAIKNNFILPYLASMVLTFSASYYSVRF